MNNQEKKWELMGSLKKSGKKDKVEGIVETLLANRGIRGDKQNAEFFGPIDPDKIKPEEVKISRDLLSKAIGRIKKAISGKEKIIIYGDYDTDGVCATAILWETLYSLKADVLPYIPNRFEEGYGLNQDSVKKLKAGSPDLKLIITVDNGIVAREAIEEANKLGIDTIVTDHHQKDKSLPRAYALIHTDVTSGSAISWFFSREIMRKLHFSPKEEHFGLELAAVGTIADQIPLIGINRSIAKHGLKKLGETQRPGLIALFREAGLYRNGSLSNMGTYEVNYVIAPRINAMGRLEHAIDSLRLLCTKSTLKASELALKLGGVNQKRQKIVGDVLTHAREMAKTKNWEGAIVLAHESYHEGVIGLAAGKLTEEFGRPSIVLSKGEKFSKGSARSITGFNIIEAIRMADKFLEGAGGHPMAAGLKIKTENLDAFIALFEKISKSLLNGDILQRKLKIDLELGFGSINYQLFDWLLKFEPSGIGNPAPNFVTKKVMVVDARAIGMENKHLKLRLEQENVFLEAIAFGFGGNLLKIIENQRIDIVYTIDENFWNGKKNLQLKIKDIRFT